MGYVLVLFVNFAFFMLLYPKKQEIEMITIGALIL